MPFCFESVAFWGCSFGIEARDRIDWADAALALAAFQAGFSNHFRLAGNTSSDAQRKLWKRLFEHFADRLGRLESCWRKSYGKPKCRLSYHRCGR